MPIKFDVKMTDKVMFNFMIHHNYSSFSGIMGVIFGVLSLFAGIYRVSGGDGSRSLIYFLVAFMFILYMPFSMWMKARSQVKHTPMFHKPITYELLEEGVRVSQDGQSVLNPWTDFQKVISTGQSLVLYMSRVRAIVLPKEQMGELYIPVVKMISAHIEPAKMKIRGV